MRLRRLIGEAATAVLDLVFREDAGAGQQVEQAHQTVIIAFRHAMLLAGRAYIVRPDQQFGRRRQAQTLHAVVRALRHGIIAADVGDLALLVEGDPHGRGGCGRINVHHLAQDGDLPRLVDTVVLHIAGAVGEGRQGVAIQRRPRLDLEPFGQDRARRDALHQGVGRGHQNDRSGRVARQLFKHRHAPPHALSRGRGTVVGQAVPRRQDQGAERAVAGEGGQGAADLVRPPLAGGDQDGQRRLRVQRPQQPGRDRRRAGPSGRALRLLDLGLRPVDQGRFAGQGGGVRVAFVLGHGGLASGCGHQRRGEPRRSIA